MKESFWRLSTLVLVVVLIVVVASWASGQKKKKDEEEPKLPNYAEDKLREGVIIERSYERYKIQVGAGNKGTEMEKILLYDSWDVVNTTDVWFMDDCHTSHPEWKRIPFSKK